MISKNASQTDRDILGAGMLPRWVAVQKFSLKRGLLGTRGEDCLSTPDKVLWPGGCGTSLTCLLRRARFSLLLLEQDLAEVGPWTRGIIVIVTFMIVAFICFGQIVDRNLSTRP